MCASLKGNENTSLTDSDENIYVDGTGVVRKYLNGAVWVESPADPVRYSPKAVNSKKSLKLKRVSCSCSSLHNCKFHDNGISIYNSTSNSKTEIDVISEEKRRSNISSEEDLNRSDTVNADDEKEDGYKKWMLKKIEEKKRIERNNIKILQNAEIEKKERLAQEQENFKRWLDNKKKQQVKQKSKKEKQLEREKSKEAQKERRKLESKLRYQLWLKRKEQQELEKKLEEQMAIIKISDERQRRIEENQTAFNSWLKQSGTKQKPVTVGKGLESLRSCVSVTYKNPIPWAPNIDHSAKPASL